jgi:arylsulfatase A-like enzyme
MGTQPRNIVFVLTDQERYFGQYPAELDVPGRRWLMDRGVSFTNHYIASTMCTSSRSAIYTGQHMPNTGMFDNANFDFVGSMSPEIPTVGTMLRDVGYYTAYKGKWHLASELDPDPGRDHNFSGDMERYGFSDWNPTGDVIGDPWDGFVRDNGTMVAAVEWLRAKGLKLRAEGTPWFLSVDLVNPHDIMYYNTDQPGEAVQDAGGLLFPTTRAPQTPLYAQSYADVVPESFTQEIEEEGRPAAHREFEGAMALALGSIPAEADRWQRFNDYYLNCMKEVDRKIHGLITELDELGFLEDTIIVFTADHGEMGGAHGMRGKGGNGYEESIHVPLMVVTPDGPGGVTCDAVTSHVDLAPTLVNFGTGSNGSAAASVASLPGKDLTPLVHEPTGDAATSGVRDAALFAYSGALTLDADFLGQVGEIMMGGGDPADIKKAGVRPDLTKRGFQRTMVDGRYKYTRYFAPTQHHVPDSVDEVRELNDVEVFDLREDPHEMTNLAAHGTDHDDLIAELNQRMSMLIREEIGAAEDGRYLPPLPHTNFAVTDLKNI